MRHSLLGTFHFACTAMCRILVWLVGSILANLVGPTQLHCFYVHYDGHLGPVLLLLLLLLMLPLRGPVRFDFILTLLLDCFIVHREAKSGCIIRLWALRWLILLLYPNWIEVKLVPFLSLCLIHYFLKGHILELFFTSMKLSLTSFRWSWNRHGSLLDKKWLIFMRLVT